MAYDLNKPVVAGDLKTAHEEAKTYTDAVMSELAEQITNMQLAICELYENTEV